MSLDPNGCRSRYQAISSHRLHDRPLAKRLKELSKAFLKCSPTCLAALESSADLPHRIADGSHTLRLQPRSCLGTFLLHELPQRKPRFGDDVRLQLIPHGRAGHRVLRQEVGDLFALSQGSKAMAFRTTRPPTARPQRSSMPSAALSSSPITLISAGSGGIENSAYLAPRYIPPRLSCDSTADACSPVRRSGAPARATCYPSAASAWCRWRRRSPSPGQCGSQPRGALLRRPAPETDSMALLKLSRPRYRISKG